MKEKILIVGGSHSEIPLILAAKEQNLHVITTGNQKNGLGHGFADETHLVDYADARAIYSLAQRLHIDHICFGAHDYSMMSTAYTAEKLGFTHYDDFETNAVLHIKDLKKFAAKHGSYSPRQQVILT